MSMGAILAIDTLAVDATAEIERFASFDHPTRRFIAHALGHVSPWPGAVGDLTHPINPPLPFTTKDAERLERAAAYVGIARLRACNHKGPRGQAMRRQEFGTLLTMARCDLKWKRLTTLPAFIFCYERLAGHLWRQLLVPCWNEATLQRRRKGPTQLPLDRRLTSDAVVPHLLEDDAGCRFYPTLADADAFGAPLLGLL